MREEAAVHWAEDYESLRERARAHLGGEASAASELASRPRGNVRVISSVPTVDVEAPPRRRPEPARVPAPRSYGSRRGAAAPRPVHQSRPPRPSPPSRPARRPTAGHRRRAPAIARVAAEPDRAALWAV